MVPPGGAAADILADAAEALIREAMGEPPLDACCRQPIEAYPTPRPPTSKSASGPAWLRCEFPSPARTSSSIRPERFGYQKAGRSSSPICIWRRAHPSRAVACFCRPMTPAPTLLALATLVLRRNPRCIVSLGDSFHDSGGYGRLMDADRARLAIAAARARVDFRQRQSRSRAARRYWWRDRC